MSNFPSAPPPGAYVAPSTDGHPTPQASTPQASTPAPNPQQQYYQQQAQGPAPNYGSAAQHSGPHKSQGISQMFNQAVTTGKPMFNKFSKQISAKLSGKQPAQPTPQHLAGSYQNYQNHQQQQIPQGYQQAPLGQQSPQPAQPQWQSQAQHQQAPHGQQSPQPTQPQWQPQAQQQQNIHPPSQQPSPFPQSNYATPASANSGQSNYFASQQIPPPGPPPGSQAPPQQQPNSPVHNPNQFTQGQNVGIQHQQIPPPGPPPGFQAPSQQQPNSPGHNPNQSTQGQTVGIQQQHQGQAGSGQFPQGQWQQPGQVNQGQQPGQVSQGQQLGHAHQSHPQAQPSQGQQQAPLSPGQQHAPFSPIQQQAPPSQIHHQGQPNQSQQQGQIQQTGSQHGQFSEQQTTGVIGSSPSPHASISTPNYPPQPNSQYQPQQQWIPQPSPTPGNVNPTNPAMSSPALQNVQPTTQTPPPQPYSIASSVPTHGVQPPSENKESPKPGPVQRPPPVPKPHREWRPASPTSPQGPDPNRIPPPPGPPPPETSASPPPTQSSPIHMNGFPPPKTATPEPPRPRPIPSGEFVAELPGDLGNPQRPSPSIAASYQAYQPPTAGRGPSPGHVIPRRAVSMISMPLADPWSIAEASTELPTREFYIIADLLFDALDKRFEPKNTGLLEAPKILESWRVQELAEEAAQLFAYDSFSAFARLWSLEGIPHIMVPSQSSLSPSWNFRPQSHSHEMVIPPSPIELNQGYPSYVPALNRAGWYKYFFLEMIVEPEGLDKMLPAFCSDTYKPKVLNQPDLQKRDRTELTGLVGRANRIRNAAMARVCQEAAKAMQIGREAGEKDTKGLLGQEQAMAPSQSPGAGNDYMPRY